MEFELESNRLILRALNQEYASNVCEFYERNYHYLSLWEPNLSRHFLSIEAMKNLMKADFKNTLLGNNIRYWFSLKSFPDNIIGAVNFQNIKKGAFKSCQIGYKIDKAFSGMGITAEAAHCTISSLFLDEGLHRIEAIIATNNLPSIKLIERLGFLREGINRECVNINGSWVDCYQYSLLNGELKA